MTATVLDHDPPPAADERHPFAARGGRADAAFRMAAIAAGLVVLVVLGAIAVTTLRRASPAFDQMGLGFLTSSRWDPNTDHFGAKGFLYGSLVASTIALVLAVPVSIGIALFTTQVVPARWRRPIVYLVDLLAVVPSVVFGLWGILVFAKKLPGFYDNLSSLASPIPGLRSLFGTAHGRSFMTAGIILAVMITPIITSLAREVIDTCPQSDREGAYAIGATRWEMIRGTVLPHSKGGLVGAVMLGLGRALGETIAVALVIGSANNISANLFDSGDALPARIANEWGEAEGTWRAALIGLAVVLFAVTILINLLAAFIVNRSLAKSQGAR
jgi:phosphate transport system permease protein